LSFIEGHKDVNDKQRTLYKLTSDGIEQSLLLDQYLLEAAEAFNNLSDELEVDFQKLLDKACKALEAKPFAKRFPSLMDKNS
jgi:hypothetical protein